MRNNQQLYWGIFHNYQHFIDFVTLNEHVYGLPQNKDVICFVSSCKKALPKYCIGYKFMGNQLFCTGIFYKIINE